MDTLLHPIVIYVEIAKLICNYYDKSLNIISYKWDVDVKKYIRFQGLVKWTPKFIADNLN